MAINLIDIHNAAVAYILNQLVPSITVTPLPAGSSEINPDEFFSIFLKASNSPGADSLAIVITNLRYHVSVTHESKARLIVPPTSVAVARTGPDPSNLMMLPGTEEQDMYLFPSTDFLLGSDGVGSLTIQGKALDAGKTKVTLELLGDIDLSFLFPANQRSLSSSQSVSIVT